MPKVRADGRTQLHLTVLELIDRLAALIPPPRIHRYRYQGVLAPLHRCTDVLSSNVVTLVNDREWAER